MILVKPDGSKSIVETHNRGDASPFVNPNGGVNVYDFEQRVQTYDGTVAFARLEKPLDDDRRIAFTQESMDRYSQIPFDEAYVKHFLLSRILKIHPPSHNDASADTRPRGMSCAQFIGYLQQEIGIRKWHEHIDRLTPDNIARRDMYCAAVTLTK
jgi:hypothetical protein